MSLWLKYRYLILTFFLGFMASLILVLVAHFNQHPAQRMPAVQGSPASVTQVVVEKHYALCGHTVRLPVDPELKKPGIEITRVRLAALYPAEEGWTVEEKVGQWRLTQEVDGFCPEDQDKTHLGVSGDYVAVIRGPRGVDGGLVAVTDIRVDILPREWQSQVRKGELGFISVQQLREALDSLDEFAE